MPYRQVIDRQLKDIASYRKSFHQETNEGHYHKISHVLMELEDCLREQMQSHTTEEMINVINKLEADDALTHADLELIRLWMVSDAEFYVQMENDYPDWLAELNRLVDTIGGLYGPDLSLSDMGRISGSARDAIRVIGDIVYFKQQEERIKNFERATQRLYSEDKRAIAEILKRKLHSDQM